MLERNHRLDGLRGIAALFVAIGHCATAVGGLDAYRLTYTDVPAASLTDIGFRMIHVFINADAAVPIFFVLSGYVLTLSFDGRILGGRDFSTYAIRRAFRLFPVSIVSAILIGVLRGAPWTLIALTGLLIDYKLNSVIWSLQVEVVGSILIYAVTILTRCSSLLLYVVLLVLCILAYAYPNYLLLLLPCFALGAIIHRLHGQMFNGMVACFALALVLFSDFYFSHGVASRFVQMFGCFAVVGFVVNHGSALLNSRPIQFLGDLSYPFYLLHPFALAICNIAADNIGVSYLGSKSFIAWATLSIVSVTISICVSWAIRKIVEIPGINLGTMLVRNIRSTDARPITLPAE